jgi:hypothetical protein
MTNNQQTQRWFIDLGWLEQHNRSFFTLVQDSLCSKCTERLRKGKKQFSPADFISIIKTCCSKTPEFITNKAPVLYSIFRLFLANGNLPLDLEELGKQLSERCGGYPYRISVEVLPRLLKSDQYYGLRQVAD